MAKQLYLHIGAPKSATTYLQSVLRTNRDDLRNRGVLVPTDSRAGDNRVARFARQRKPTDRNRRTFERVARKIREWDGNAVISQEWLTMLDEHQISQLVEAFHPADVHIIFTARSLVGSVSAAWQEELKLGFGRTVRDFVVDLDSEHPRTRWGWRTLDASVVLPRWEAAVRKENIHVVTVPPREAGPDELWRRFASAFGATDLPVDTSIGKQNESISAESAKLLQIIGPELRNAIAVEEGPWTVPYTWVRDLVAQEILTKHGGHKIALPRDIEQVVLRREERNIAALKASPYDIIGAPSELAFRATRSARVPDDVPEHDVLQAACTLIPRLLAETRRHSDRAKSLEREKS